MRLIDADALIEKNADIIDCEIDHPKYQDTLREIIDDAPTVNQWIPCSERLPLPDENPVLVSWMGMTNIGWFSCGRWETGTRLPMDGVEAWMPMPEPWKGENDD